MSACLYVFLAYTRDCSNLPPSQIEVVLCVLLDKFKFQEPKDKTIYWQMSALVTPTVNGEREPKLPLIVSRAD